MGPYQHQNTTTSQRENRILSAVAFASSILLKSANWRDAVTPALEQLGKATVANRSYYFENSMRDDGVVLTSQVAEWVAAGIEPQIDNPELQNFPYVENGMGRWLELMSQRKPVHGLTSSFPECERAILEVQDIQSIVVMPVFAQDRLTGFLGFDDCESLRKWSAAELDALFAAASAIGAAIDRHHLENQLRFAQKMETIGGLASGIAHDFNNMLQAISGFVNVAKLKLEPEHSAQQDLDDVLEASNRAHGLTQQLLSFSRKREASRKEINLTSVIESVVKMIRPSLTPSVDLTIDLEEPAPWVIADGDLLSQVLLNLCLNACDAMPDGGQLTISAQSLDGTSCDLIGPEFPNGTFAKFTVTDTGAGMLPDIRKQIFEPFFTTKSVGSGTGLGLSVAYTTVNKCGGWIDVKSTPGVGSQFDVFLPQADPPVTVGEPDLKKSLNGGSETILLVDDESMVLQPTRILLQASGYEVMTATSGRQGLNVFKEHSATIDAVITDSVMPEMSGREMLHEIFRICPETQAILVSGNPDSAKVAAADGNVVVISKPFSNRQLQTELRRLLD